MARTVVIASSRTMRAAAQRRGSGTSQHPSYYEGTSASHPSSDNRRSPTESGFGRSASTASSTTAASSHVMGNVQGGS